MNYSKKAEGSRMEIVLEGKLDAVSSPKFEAEVSEELDGINEILIDMSGVEYISSAGLRALLYLQQTLDEVDGKVKVCKIPEAVEKVFAITGFNEIVTVI